MPSFAYQSIHIYLQSKYIAKQCFAKRTRQSRVVDHECKKIIENYQEELKGKYVGRDLKIKLKELKNYFKKFKSDVINNDICENNDFSAFRAWYLEFKIEYKNELTGLNNNSYTSICSEGYEKLMPLLVRMNQKLARQHELHSNDTSASSPTIKNFQLFPLRTNLIPHHIKIDTYVLADILLTDLLTGKPNNDLAAMIIFGHNVRTGKTQQNDQININAGKSEIIRNIEKYKIDIWNKLINNELHVLRKQDKFVFDYLISTNGFDVSIYMLKNEYMEKKQKFKQKKIKGKKNFTEKTKGMTKEQIQEYRDENKQQKNKITRRRMPPSLREALQAVLKLKKIKKYNLCIARNASLCEGGKAASSYHK
jgi:hypothetical protein